MFWYPNNSAMIFAWLVQCIILMGFVWFDKYRIPEESYDCWLVKGMRGFAFIFFTVIALMFIDTNIKLLMGIAGYGNFSIHLASMILTFILAAHIIIGAVLVAPNRKGVITFIVVLITFIILWEFIFLDFETVSLLGVDTSGTDLFILGILFPVAVGLLVAIGLTFIEGIIKKSKSERTIADKPFWNKQIQAKRIFSFKFNLIMWIIITTEFILNMQGLSLLFWISIFM